MPSHNSFTPNHYALVIRCLEAGLHVLVENRSPKRWIRRRRWPCRREEQACAVGHIERFNPAYLELKNVLKVQRFAVNFRR
jgi:hypothetical protein